MKRIKLTQGKVALVDDADYDWLKEYNWFALKNYNEDYYAVRSVQVDGKWDAIRMHRQLLGLKPGDKREADHRDHNTLDNRRSNIRICTRSQNQMNQKPQRRITTSRFKGVYWKKQAKKWAAQIAVDGKRMFLGYYNDEGEAALAYNKAAKKYFGNFAFLNNIP